MNIIVNIENMNVCNIPENTSKYACKTGVIKGATKPRALYIKDIMITPLNMFPKRRNDKDMGFATSPKIFSGSKNGNGSRNPFKYPPIPLFLIP